MAIFSAFTLTLITTLLILYRIIVMTRRTNLPRQTRNTYKDIVDMIIQSAALYCIVLLIWAISWAITPASTLSGSVRQIPFYYLSKIIEEVCFLVAVSSIPFSIPSALNKLNFSGNGSYGHGQANSARLGRRPELCRGFRSPYVGSRVPGDN